MQKLKDRKTFTLRVATLLILIVICCKFPSIPFLAICLKEDLFRPSNTEVIISACKDPTVRGVPGGEMLFVSEGRTGKVYLLDLRTGERKPVPNDPLLLDNGIFLSSELVWLKGSLVWPDNPGYRPHYILDLTNGQRYELLDLGLLPRLEDFKFDSQYYSYFQEADYVFIDYSENTLIALFSDFREASGRKVIFSQYAISQGSSTPKGELLAQLMEELGVDYQVVDFSPRYSNILSPTGRYVVRKDGIYFSETSTKIDTGGLFGDLKGWFYDESGIVVQEAADYLINHTLLGTYYSIPKPVLKLHLPSP